MHLLRGIHSAIGRDVLDILKMSKTNIGKNENGPSPIEVIRQSFAEEKRKDIDFCLDTLLSQMSEEQ